jgi:hypothetical protein
MSGRTPYVSSAVDGVRLGNSVAASPHVATAQGITGQATISARCWGAQQSRDHSAVIRWRSAPTAKEITLCAATEVRRSLKLPRQRGRVGE